MEEKQLGDWFRDNIMVNRYALRPPGVPYDHRIITELYRLLYEYIAGLGIGDASDSLTEKSLFTLYSNIDLLDPIRGKEAPPENLDGKTLPPKKQVLLLLAAALQSELGGPGSVDVFLKIAGRFTRVVPELKGLPLNNMGDYIDAIAGRLTPPPEKKNCSPVQPSPAFGALLNKIIDRDRNYNISNITYPLTLAAYSKTVMDSHPDAIDRYSEYRKDMGIRVYEIIYALSFARDANEATKILAEILHYLDNPP